MPNSNIVTQDIISLLDGWIEAERKGVEFPVPLHDYWNIAGHKKTQDAFKLLESRQEDGFDYLRSTVNSAGGGSGRKRQARFLTVAALERLCLAAHTTEGDAVRELYRQSKAKWDLTKQVAPEIAQEVEIMHLKIELAKQEAIAAVANKESQSLRHYVVTALPQAVADRILGVTEVTKVITKEVVVSERGEVLGHVPGETMNKRELCERYGIVTRTGNPDYKQLNAFLGGLNLPPDAFIDRQVVTHNAQLKVEYLPQLEAWIKAKPSQRNLGE